MEWFVFPIFSFIAVLMLIPPARKIALRHGFVDEPGGRKQHKEQVPPVGGLVIFPVFIICAILAGVSLEIYWSLFAALTLLLVMGAMDDKAEITPWVKFAIQFLAAFLIVIPGHAQLVHLGDLFGLGTVWMGWFSIPLSVFCVALLINSINLMDGLDGLAAGQSVVMLFWLILACMMAGLSINAMIVGILAGALLGFLFYNMRTPWRKRANIFLGDAGSMCLGLALAWFFISLGQGSSPVITPVSVAWIIALPVMDACGQFFRRMKEGRHPFSPDRGHFHHHFRNADFSAGQTTAIIIFIGAMLGAIGYGGMLLGVPPIVLSLGWVALLAAHMVLSLNPAPFIKFLKKLRK
jgi:UDP-GlcNAc:undecaprenyl-phosphate GlcNAc-1-phosphate transferase